MAKKIIDNMLEDAILIDAPEVDNVQAEREDNGTITKADIRKAASTLEEYKSGKANLDKKIVNNERWYKMRHWELIRNNVKEGEEKPPEPTSAWLLNSIINKHADAMDNFPEPSILPREQGDEAESDKLTSILPVILEQNDYEKVYSDKWWYKLKMGLCVTGVFWNNSKNNGLGDIDIKKIDVLNLFWQPGISDIQDSRNVFNVKLEDNEALIEQYPILEGKLGGDKGTISKYVMDDTIPTADKSNVVDWYYKRRNKLHYCKFVNDEILFASENDETLKERGWYDHGLYPFVFDSLFVEEGTLAAFGYIDIMKDPQLYIDKLNQIIITNAYMVGKKRWFVKGDGAINETEFANWDNTFVHVTGGSLEDRDIREITTTPLSDTVVNTLTNKIEELKETSGNRDFSQGGTTSGVTAASAIAALQEAGSKTSRDMIKSSYRAFKEETSLVIELIRQFYDEARSFRIIGEDYKTSFTQYDNANIKDINQGNTFGEDMGFRKPVFDISVKAHRANPFSKVSQNELAKEFYGLQFFNPQYADQALVCIEMMDFDGKQKIVQKISENGTMYQQLMQMQQTIAQLAQIVDMQNGSTISQEVGGQQQQPSMSTPTPNASSGVAQGNSLGKAVQTTNNTTASTAKERAINTANPK